MVVSDDDIAAAKKLLEKLVNASSAVPGDVQEAPIGSPADRREMLARARAVCEVRERRLHLFDFSAEAPFLLLLALYANEEWEPVITLTRLTQLAWLSLSTSIRWLDQLVEQGLIERGDDAGDGRKTLLSLTTKARTRLDELFE